MFLIHDDQSKIVEAHIRAEQAVGAHDQVHLTICHESEDAILLARGPEPADLIGDNGKTLQSFLEGVEVLLAQDGGGHQHGDLLAGVECLECGAQGNLGFAKTDIPADESIHGSGEFHVGLGLPDCRELIGCFLEREGGFEALLPCIIPWKWKTLHCFPSCLQCEELRCEIEGGEFGGFAILFPLVGSDFAELWGAFGQSHVAREQVALA